jgi:predicted Zn-dependent protease
MRKIIFAFSAVVVFLFCESCAKNPVTGKKDFMLMSKEQEVAMGQQSDPEITQFFGIYEDEKLQRFINEKGQQMVGVSHRKDIKYQFKVVDSDVVNAFAVPGGYVYFTRGIMAYFNNEAEFAGVLGHEIGHITARHSAKQYSNSMLAQLGLAAGMIFSPEFAQFGDVASQGLQLLFLKFGRDAESESDRLGVEYSTKIGYDAEEMAGFFGTLDRLRKNSGGEEVPDFLSTHPNPLDRERKVGKLAKEWKAKVGASTLKVNQDSYLRMIDGLVYGEDPKQGFVENSVFYHPVLKFQFGIPQQWAVQNTPQAVQMAQPNGKAMMMMTLAEGNSLENAAQTLLKNYQLTVLESKQDQVNGLPAIKLVAEQQPQQQQGQGQQQASVRVLIYLIQYGGNIYSMLGVSAPNDFNSFARVFQGSMESFKELTDPSKLNKQPQRIQIKEVPQSGSLAQAFRSLHIKEDRMEELATLNGMTLKENVQRGKLIKIVQ